MLEQFCSFLQGQGKSENTVKSYRLAVDGYMKWYRATFGDPVRQLYRANVLDYISYLRTVKRLANQAGHSNVHTTLLYTNPTREKMKEKANLL